MSAVEVFLILILIIAIAEPIARLIIWVFCLLKPSLFEEGFNVWTHPIKGGWIHYLTQYIEK